MTRSDSHKMLLIGYGNPAREDDGIGPVVAEEIEKLGIEGLSIHSDYQLSVEDSVLVSEHDIVVFVDASAEGAEPFTFSPIVPDRTDSFSTHSVHPKQVMGLAYDLFSAKTDGYLLGIRGYSFSMFKEKMTSQACENTMKALEFLVPMLRAGSFCCAELK